MSGPVTGLSSDILEYIILGLTLLSPVVGFFVGKTQSKLLSMVRTGVELLRGWFMKEKALADQKAKEPPPADPPA